MKKVLTLTILLTIWSVGNCYNILGIFSHNGKSHFDVFEPLMKELAKKGHKVTVISYFPQKTPLRNYEDVSLKDTAPILVDAFEMDMLKQSRLARYADFFILLNMGQSNCESALSANTLKDFLKTKRNFDVIIGEFFYNECYLGLVHKFKAPLVGMTTSVMFAWNDVKIGNPSNPAYIPNNFLPFSDKLTFLDRVENTLLYLIQSFVYNYFVSVQNDKIARELLGDDLPPLGDIARNCSMMMVNSHFSLNGARPFVPGLVEVGGLHIGKPKRLPQNIEKWINESSHGVIYFSLGSMIKGHTFPEEKRQMFLRAFGRLPQRVLWKWETETMPGKPDNVMIQKWMPQFDILCHPNVKAFIAHGGLLGTTEAVHCGVPMVIMPQFGDQFTNAKAVEASGGGVILDFRSLDEESVYNALKTVLDPSSNKKAKELSARFRDRPLPPLDTAIYWVEYVARHGGAPHLRTAAVGMPLYQYLLLDVMAFLALILIVMSYVTYFVTKAIFRRMFGSKPSTQKVKKS